MNDDLLDKLIKAVDTYCIARSLDKFYALRRTRHAIGKELKKREEDKKIQATNTIEVIDGNN